MRTPSPLAGKLPPASLLVDVDRLLAAYQDDRPDPSDAAQRVVFGTSGHRGTSLQCSFNAWHVLAIAQAVCDYRKANGVDGPLYLGIDTHALSAPACASALEVLAANGVDTMLAINDEYTPTPAVSHAILTHNKWRTSGFADGIVITPSHNPPQDGGIKYNPLHGGPAGTDVTRWIEDRANALLEQGLSGVRRMPHADALNAATTHRHDFLGTYVADLDNVVDLNLIGNARLKIGVDPMGGAGVHYWPVIADRYRLDLTVVNAVVDPTFRFIPVDGDGQIRMDPSSPYAMQGLIEIRDRFDIAFACDTDHDRHGIVTRDKGLLPPNHYLTVVVDYLFRHRADWSASVGVGKSVVTTSMMDLVAQRLGRAVYEMPVGFKWFVPGLQDGSIGVACEESAGTTFVRRDGAVWTTDKDGIVAALLAAEITAATGHDPGALYAALANAIGAPVADRIEAPADSAQMRRLARLSPADVTAKTLAGERIERVADTAPGNGEAIGGIKVTTRNGWFAARPSGTEPLYKIYAESFKGPEHLQRIVGEAQRIVDDAIAGDAT
ncbi:MAG: phosphoglucomutase (alpha-D-glucose-1,6-bisphosphate-dependent) [Burkholderiaceae bacterium]